MDPVTTGKYEYPHGYVAYMNEAGQTVNPLTGRTVLPSDPFAWVRARLAAKISRLGHWEFEDYRA
jgi:hypothetical protein